MEEIFSATDTKHLPQAILDLKTVNGKSYASQGTSTPYIQFEIPASLGFVASEDITLNFDFVYTDSTGQVRKVCPAEAQGIGGMLHSIDIYSVADGVLLESIQDIETLNATYMSSGVGANDQVESGKAKKMSITEGYVRDAQEVCPFWTPNADPNTPVAINTTRKYQLQKICLPLRYSALLGGSQVVPVSALGGLRVNIQCNPCALFSNVRLPDVLRESKLEARPSTGVGAEIPDGLTITLSSITGGNKTYTVAGADQVGSFVGKAALITAIQAALAAANATQNAGANTIAIHESTNPGEEFQFAVISQGGTASEATQVGGTYFDKLFTNTFPVTVTEGAAATPLQYDLDPTSNDSIRYSKLFLKHSKFELNNISDYNTCPFVIGQQLRYDVSAGTLNVATGASISNIKAESDPLVSATNFMCLTFNANLPENIKDVAIGQGRFQSLNDFGGLEYSLTNVSLTVPVVSVPPSYAIALTKAIQSDNGLNMNIRTWALQRGNTQTGESQATILIPSIQTKAKGVLSVPYQAGNGDFLAFNLANNVSNPRISAYYYEYFGIRNPEQAVDTRKLVIGSRVPAELLWEQDKSFSSCFGEPLETYQGYDDKFRNRCWFLGRALSQFNGFMDLRFANLQLVVQATTSVGSMEGNWNWDNHISVVHTLNIKSEGVTLMM